MRGDFLSCDPLTLRPPASRESSSVRLLLHVQSLLQFAVGLSPVIHVEPSQVVAEETSQKVYLCPAFSRWQKKQKNRSQVDGATPPSGGRLTSLHHRTFSVHTGLLGENLPPSQEPMEPNQGQKFC